MHADLSQRCISGYQLHGLTEYECGQAENSACFVEALAPDLYPLVARDAAASADGLIFAPQEVNQRVHEIMQHHLTAACNPGMPLSPAAPPGLLGVCASLRVLTTLEPYAPEYVARFTPLLVKLLNRVARDHASPGGLVLDPTRQPRGGARCGPPYSGYTPQLS